MKNQATGATKVREFGFRTPRFKTNFNFSFEINSTHQRHEALCRNISEDGLAAELMVKVPPNTEVTLWLLFPGNVTPVQIHACVQYRRDHLHGFNFLYSSLAERSQVREFIQLVRS